MEELGVKALSILVDNLQKGADLMPAYVQDLFQRYIEFETVSNYYGIGICGFLLIGSICLLIYGCKEYEPGAMIIGGVWTLFMLVAIGVSVYELFRLMYVPELYMIDDLMSYGNCR